MDDNVALTERIRAHCASVGWYGPEMEINVDRSAPWPRNPWYAFPYPPATDEQIAQTEHELGFELPPLLRMLYQELGNGGFGPGYGLLGASGGHPAESSPEHQFVYEEIRHPTLANTLSRNSWRVPLRDLARLEQDPESYLSEVPQPGMTVSLVGWGCDIYTLLHCDSGYVYGFAQGGLEVSATSIGQWLEQWLAGTLVQPFSHGEDAVWLRAFGQQEWARFHARRFSNQ
jgi:hypothetical protein